jgi:hypothetical protein
VDGLGCHGGHRGQAPTAADLGLERGFTSSGGAQAVAKGWRLAVNVDIFPLCAQAGADEAA